MERFIKFTKIYLECTLEYVGGVQIVNVLVLTHFGGKDKNVYTGCIKKKLNKPEIALRLCNAPQCTKFFY